MWFLIVFIQLFVLSLGISPDEFLRSKRASDSAHSHSHSHTPIWRDTWTDKLRRDLLATYDKYARPAQHTNTTVINLEITLYHVELDEAKFIMKVYSHLHMDWMDEKLSWNSSDYGGIKAIHLSDNEGWLPDILPYNNARGSVVEHYGHTNQIVYENGMTIWVPPTLFHVFCEMNLRNWPFDVQHCMVKLGSWTYNGEQMNLEIRQSEPGVEVSKLIITNSEWKILKLEKSKEMNYYPCCPEPYAEVNYFFTLARVSDTYKALVITPIIGILIMTLSTFWLPPVGCEKILLCGTNLIVICLFLLYFTQKLPAMAGNTPLIVVFYSTSLYLVIVAIVVSVVVINLAKNPISKTVPGILKHALTGWLGKLLFLENFILHAPKSTSQELQDQSAITKQRDLPEGQTIEPVAKSSNADWILVAVAIDRIFFILYGCLYVILALTV